MPDNTDLHTSVANLGGESSAPAGIEPGALGSAPSEDVEDGLEVTSDVFDGPAIEATLADLDDLPDIATASYGELGGSLESIIGTDDRVQVTATANYPWRVHASLLITAADGSRWIGTGWFLGPHTLGTAGHVVFIKNSGVPGRDGWVRSIQVIPGRNGNQQPYGSVTSNNFRSVTGWTNNGDQNYDYGAILLPTELGQQTGWLGFGNFDDATIRSSVANIAGYPGDKPAGTLWFHASDVVDVNALKVFYKTDTVGGQSGSAVYRYANGQRHAFAVHAYGGASSNSGTRINAQVFANLQAWKA
jgi:glutamyl endopeptidase